MRPEAEAGGLERRAVPEEQRLQVGGAGLRQPGVQVELPHRAQAPARAARPAGGMTGRKRRRYMGTPYTGGPLAIRQGRRAQPPAMRRIRRISRAEGPRGSGARPRRRRHHGHRVAARRRRARVGQQRVEDLGLGPLVVVAPGPAAGLAVERHELRRQRPVGRHRRGRRPEPAEGARHQRRRAGADVAGHEQREAELVAQRLDGAAELHVVLVAVLAPGGVGDHGAGAGERRPQPVAELGEAGAVAGGVEALHRAGTGGDLEPLGGLDRLGPGGGAEGAGLGQPQALDRPREARERRPPALGDVGAAGQRLVGEDHPAGAGEGARRPEHLVVGVRHDDHRARVEREVGHGRPRGVNRGCHRVNGTT